MNPWNHHHAGLAQHHEYERSYSGAGTSHIDSVNGMVAGMEWLLVVGLPIILVAVGYFFF